MKRQRRWWMFALISVGLFGCERQSTTTEDEIVDECPDNPNKLHPGVCGCDTDDIVDALTGVYTCLSTTIDLCPNDPYKTKPGICGCGVADTLGVDGIALCLTQNFDLCPDDPKKTLPGICGCGVEDAIDPATGLAGCIAGQLDLCPEDKNKTLPGVCGCGVPDTPDAETGIPLCTVEELDFCPLDNSKKKPGICGCGMPDIDSDEDGKLDCEETCIHNKKKFEPGICGCDIQDTTKNIADNDKDGTPNCLDFCPDSSWKQEDDGCGCDQLFYELQGVSGCAQVISSADEFIEFRNNWNDGEYPEPTNDMAFILVDDINLGTVLTQTEASQWIGVGTVERPFNAVFLGNHHKIEGIRHSGTIHQSLVFGNESALDVALFGYANHARFFDLNVDLVFSALDYVASLIARAEGSVIDNISVSGMVTGQNNIGGIIAEANSTSMSLLSCNAEIHATGDYVGGILGTMSESQLNGAEFTGSVEGGTYTGGIAGMVSKASRLLNVHAGGNITGMAMTGAVAGNVTSRSSLLNIYSTSQLTCLSLPCALLVADISDFSTVKNGYSTGLIIDNIPEDDPRNPPVGGDNPGEDSGESGEETTVWIPTAALIASFGSVDNVVEQLYYWSLTNLVPLPEAALEMSMVEPPTPFSYISFYPYIDATDSESAKLLLLKLNDALSCNIGICTLDGYTCYSWTSESRSISLPDESGDTMRVHLPVLSINGR